MSRPAPPRLFAIRCASLALALVAGCAAPLAAQAACPAGPVALVLSGGGAKGLAHVGVLRILDSAGFRPDLVVGTSMGAVVGALYASGRRGAELDAIAGALPLAAAFSGYTPEAPQTFEHLPALLVWAERGGRLALQPSAADEAAVNAMLTQLFLEANLRAGGRFDRLPIPFLAVATDLRADTAVVLGDGDLARAVRASVAIPIVFPPVHEARGALVDGGLVANLPIGVARARGAVRVIAVDVTERSPTDSLDLDSPLTLTSRLVDLLSLQPIDPLGPADLYLRPAVDDFEPLDFSRTSVRALVAAGADAARAALGTLACPLPGGAWPQPAPLPASITAVEVTGIGPNSAQRLVELLGVGPGEPVRLDSLASALATVSGREELRGLWLRPTRTPGGVALAPLVEPPPRRRAALGAAYDSDLGGRLWAGAVDRAFLGTGWEGAATLAVGGLHTGIVAGVRRQFARRGIVPTATLALERERVEFFTNDSGGVALRFDAVTRHAVGFAGVELPWHRRWVASLGLESRVWDEPGRRSIASAAAVARLAHVRRPGDRAIDLEVMLAHRYRRALADLSAVVTVGAWRLRPRVRAMGGSTLPLHLTMPLGGWDGFPGLPIGDFRGDRESFASLAVTRRVLGPLLAGVESAVGRSRLVLNLEEGSDEWINGARLFAGFESPLGPVVVGWGANSLERRRWLVRVGRWF